MGGRGARSGTSKNGKKLDPSHAAAVSNPHYNDGVEYQVNCQRCVYAFEANMRYHGQYEAMPNPNPYGYDKYAYGGWKTAMEGQVVNSVGSTSRKKVERNIDGLASSWGDGSRGIVRVQWKHGNCGHVFNFVRSNGKTLYFDAQTGRSVDLQEYLASAKPSKTLISRTDNLEFKPGVEKDLFRRVK